MAREIYLQVYIVNVQSEEIVGSMDQAIGDHETPALMDVSSQLENLEKNVCHSSRGGLKGRQSKEMEMECGLGNDVMN